MLRIGSVILQQRKKRGITQETIADYCQVSKASVSKWEKGLSYPDITLLPKLASYFEMTVDELLGFEWQLSKEEVQNTYYEFAARFGKEPFEQVFRDVEEQVKMYYHEPGFLLQMSILMLNHFMISEDGGSVLQKIQQWLDRIIQVSEDVWVLRQANSLQAASALMRLAPGETLELLKGVIKPSVGDEALLAAAYEQVGEPRNAMKTVQVLMYQNIMEVVGAGPIYLRLSLGEQKKFDETLRRTNGLIELFDLEQLHPNVCLQFYIGAAHCAAVKEDRGLLYDYLERFTDVCIRYLLPFKLRGDAYFDLLEEWLEELDLGPNALRNEELIKQSIFEALQTPFFEPYRDDEQMKQLIDRLRWGLEEGK